MVAIKCCIELTRKIPPGRPRHFLIPTPEDEISSARTLFECFRRHWNISLEFEHLSRTLRFGKCHLFVSAKAQLTYFQQQSITQVRSVRLSFSLCVLRIQKRHFRNGHVHVKRIATFARSIEYRRLSLSHWHWHTHAYQTEIDFNKSP